MVIAMKYVVKIALTVAAPLAVIGSVNKSDNTYGSS